MDEGACVGQLRARLYRAIDEGMNAEVVLKLSAELDKLLVTAILTENKQLTMEIKAPEGLVPSMC